MMMILLFLLSDFLKMLTIFALLVPAIPRFLCISQCVILFRMDQQSISYVYIDWHCMNNEDNVFEEEVFPKSQLLHRLSIRELVLKVLSIVYVRLEPCC